MYFSNNHRSDDNIKDQFDEEQYGEPDLAFSKPVTYGSKSLDKFALEFVSRCYAIFKDSVWGA